MAAAKAKPKARSKAKSKPKARPKAKKASAKRKSTAGGMNLSKYMDDLRIGGYSLDDVLESSHKNIDALADANRQVSFQGFTSG